MAPAAGNPLGIITNVFGREPLERMAATIAGHGFTHVQLEPDLPALAGPDGALTSARAREVRQVFARHGLTIAALAGYRNLVDPDADRREAGLRELEHMIELCPEYGVDCIATETGSLHPQSPWEDTAANHTPEARGLLLRVLERLLRRARPHAVTLLIEGYVNNVVATTSEAAALVDDLGGDRLGFVLDPFNYFTREDVARPGEALRRVFDALVERAPVAHAKDVAYGAHGIETPRAGEGAMDWEAYASLLQRRAPGVPLILEHLRAEDVPACRAFVERALASTAP